MVRILIAALLTLLPGLPAGVAAIEQAPALACAQVQMFHRHGCPHCARARRFLDELKQELPALEVQEHDVIADPAARQRFLALNARFGIQRPGVPSLLLCERYLVGFSPTATPGEVRAIVLGTGMDRGAGAVLDSRVELPLLGHVALDEVGLPLFTLAIGLLDGFNPCAMWVLLFLLSLLVHVHSRRRMLLIAGVFVAVSGAVYFAFMAAWLNLFLMLGMSDVVRWMIAAMALTIGAIHIKDFFASGKGVTLSIPQAAKPGFYSRVRAIVQAENLPAALLLVVLLAAMVNLLELLCTAGLPALYTRILTLQQLSTASYYAYLALYNLAYVFDDALMVAVAVFTLQRARLQPAQGRWLKLLSGATVLGLGVVLLVAPGALF